MRARRAVAHESGPPESRVRAHSGRLCRLRRLHWQSGATRPSRVCKQVLALGANYKFVATCAPEIQSSKHWRRDRKKLTRRRRPLFAARPHQLAAASSGSSGERLKGKGPEGARGAGGASLASHCWRLPSVWRRRGPKAAEAKAEAEAEAVEAAAGERRPAPNQIQCRSGRPAGESNNIGSWRCSYAGFKTVRRRKCG